MRTTVNISDGISEKLRELARRRKRPFCEVLEETIQRACVQVRLPIVIRGSRM